MIEQSTKKEVNLNPNYLDVSPIGKGKRMLVYLADAFVSFCLAIILFAVAVFPIAAHITDYTSFTDRIYANQCEMMDVLYDNDLLDYENEEGKYVFNTSLRYSAKQYLLGFLPNQERRDYVTHFYYDLAGQDMNVVFDIYEANDNRGYFSLDGERPELKEEYVDMFSPLLDPLDSLSQDGEDEYEYFVNNFFADIYSPVIASLETASYLTEDSPLYRYRVLVENNDNLENERKEIVVYATYVAEILSLLVCYLLIPMLSKRGKTMGMLALRVERINLGSFKACRRVERLILFPIQAVFALLPIMFVPVMHVEIGELFGLPYLPFLTLIALALVFISMIFMFIDKRGRALTDFMTRTIMTTNETVDQIYIAKGYKV